jgi:hypothetical protein
MATSRPVAKSRAGFFALISALFVAVPMIVATVAQALGLNHRGDVGYRASNFIFDFGAILILLTVIFSIVGFRQGGESRRLGLIGMAILGVGIVVGLGLPIIFDVLG